MYNNTSSFTKLKEGQNNFDFVITKANNEYNILLSNELYICGERVVTKEYVDTPFNVIKEAKELANWLGNFCNGGWC